MVTISKSKLKAHMLRIFREVEQSGEPVVVTDRGRPVLQITPYRDHPRVRLHDAFRDVPGQVRFHEDPDTPTADEWEDV